MHRLVIPALLCLVLPSHAIAQALSGTLITSNMNDNTATILDAGTGRLIATLPTGEGPHEVAISRDGRWGVVSNYGVRGKNQAAQHDRHRCRETRRRSYDRSP